jgi:predicted kinase
MRAIFESYARKSGKLRDHKINLMDVEKQSSIIDEAIEYTNIQRREGLKKLDESVMINEGAAVTFGKQAYPREGWAVIMAGGAGSGKGTVIKKQLLIDAKVLDVDHLKELYAMVSKAKGGRAFDFKNTDDVSDLHATIDAKGWKDTTRDLFFAANGTLQNVIFDTTGKSAQSLENMTRQAKQIGYNVSLVWVVTNREVAMLRNLLRDRVVGEFHFHDIHNKVKETIFPFLRSGMSKNVDEAWVVFSGTEKVEYADMPQTVRDMKDSVLKLQKSGDAFDIPQALEDKVMSFLGKSEPAPNAPRNYVGYDDVKAAIAPYMQGGKYPKNYGTLDFKQ